MNNEERTSRKGAFVVARKLFDSPFWLNKPATWKVIWIYIIGNVAHKDTPRFKRGHGFFNFSQCYRDIGIDVTADVVKKCLHSLRSSTMISTRRSTRGINIIVLNYAKYQDLDNYKAPREAPREAPPEAREKHERSTTIHKNEKNEKNIITPAMYKYENIDNEGNPTKRVATKVSKEVNDMLISVGLMWRDMASEHLQILKHDVIMLNLYYPIRKTYDREKWTKEDYKNLFKYFLNDSNIKYEDKLSFDLCLSQKYITKYKLNLKKKSATQTNVSLASELKL
jgi:hypothetical protein